MDSVLNEYSVRFFLLLGAGQRNRFEDYLMLAKIALLPNMKMSAQKSFLKQLESATRDPGAILKQSNDYSGIDKLRGILG